MRYAAPKCIQTLAYYPVQHCHQALLHVHTLLHTHYFYRRFVMGSNKVLQVALGKTPADELRTGLSQISAKLAGHVGLLFTRMAKDEVRRFVVGAWSLGLSVDSVLNGNHWRLAKDEVWGSRGRMH